MDDLTASMLGGLPPEAAKYTDILENDLAPDYLKSAAKNSSPKSVRRSPP